MSVVSQDSVISLACTLGHQSIVIMIVDAVLGLVTEVPCVRCKLTPASMFEKEGPNGHSPLQICAQKGLLEASKRLLDAGERSEMSSLVISLCVFKRSRALN